MKTKPSAIKSLLAAALAASCLASYAAAPQKREMKFENPDRERISFAIVRHLKILVCGA